jgi:hypothetical protein
MHVFLVITIIITIILGVETVYLNTHLFQALNDTEIVLSHARAVRQGLHQNLTWFLLTFY